MTSKHWAFLAAYAQCGIVQEAARIAGVGRRTHYDCLKNDPEYAQAFEEAEQEAIERMESECRRRAVEGAMEPVIYQGRVCMDVARDAATGEVLLNDEGLPILSQQPLVVPRKSDNLLMFMLKAKRPDVYRENMKVEHSGEISLVVERLAAARKRIAAKDADGS